MSDDPFTVLGLPTRLGLSDDDVRAAWRRIAAATHPDRDDGGNPAAFGRAAAAYAMLRTGYGRGEALADLVAVGGAPRSASDPGTGGTGRAIRSRLSWRLSARGRHSGRRRLPGTGRYGVLAARLAAAGIAGVSTFALAGWSPASIGVLTGALTWIAAPRLRHFASLSRPKFRQNGHNLGLK